MDACNPMSADGVSDYTFSVGDTGIGLTPEEIIEIFDPFVQLDDGSSRKYNGVGLGLTVAQRMVSLWGRTIVAESGGRGLGSTFRFSVLLKAGDGPSDSSPLSCGRLSAGTAMVVDDDPMSSRGIAQSCRALGFDNVCEVGFAAFEAFIGHDAAASKCVLEFSLQSSVCQNCRCVTAPCQFSLSPLPACWKRTLLSLPWLQLEALPACRQLALTQA